MENQTQASAPNVPDIGLVKRASYLSLIVGILLLAMKFWAYRLTHSQAVFSDAMESIVNVVAATLAIMVVIIASRPADREHPYGHGKVEYFSAAFEGGLIAFASVVICVQAVLDFLKGPQIQEPGVGVFLTIGTGLANMVLGYYLYRVGRKNNSIALTASGQHVLSDFWTSAGVTIGLLLVSWTGLAWIDPVAGFLVGAFLGLNGFRVVRRSIGGLLDEEDVEILEHLLELIRNDRPEGIIQVHHTRIIRSGSYHHIDAHVVIPEFWDVSEAHERTEKFEQDLIQRYRYEGELHLHVDPCRRLYCAECDVQNCPIRQKPFVAIRELSIEELIHPEEPKA